MRSTGNILLFVVSLLFTLAGLAMVIGGAPSGWQVLLFFGACSAVGAWQLWPWLLEPRSLNPEEVLRTFPGPVDLRMANRKIVFLMVFAAVFAGVMLSTLLTDTLSWWSAAALWLGVVFFGGSIPFLVLMLVRGSTLRLEAEGFVLGQAWRTRSVSWRETSIFEVVSIPPSYTRVVMFDDASVASGKLAAANRAIAGRNSGLQDTYGLAPEDLAALMNAWRERALGEETR